MACRNGTQTDIALEYATSVSSDRTVVDSLMARVYEVSKLRARLYRQRRIDRDISNRAKTIPLHGGKHSVYSHRLGLIS